MLSRIALFGGLLLVLAALWAWSLPGSNTGEASALRSEGDRVANFGGEISALRVELDEARAERRALALEIEGLRAELDSIAPFEVFGEEDEEVFARPKFDSSKPTNSAAPKPKELPGTGVFDEAALIALGVSASEVSRLRESFESSQMEELYLRDLATREGWLRKPRFMMELKGVRDKLRNSMSEDEFDRMLYAAGKKNRVVLAHVLHSSPAKDAGLEDGDVVLSYDDVRIFKAGELRRATTRSTSRQTPMIVERNGATIRVFLPAGPLGAQLEMRTSAPSP